MLTIFFSRSIVDVNLRTKLEERRIFMRNFAARANNTMMMVMYMCSMCNFLHALVSKKFTYAA